MSEAQLKTYLTKLVDAVVSSKLYTPSGVCAVEMQK